MIVLTKAFQVNGAEAAKCQTKVAQYDKSGGLKCLADLCPAMNGTPWRVRATVTQMQEMRTWQNATSSGKFMVCWLKDKNGSKMCLTLFNSAVERATIMELGQEYLFSEGLIKPARTQDQFHRHPYQINMDDKGGRVESMDGASVAAHPSKQKREESSVDERESD